MNVQWFTFNSFYLTFKPSIQYCVPHSNVTYENTIPPILLQSSFLWEFENRIFFNKKDWTGAITAQGPPSCWTKAVDSSSLNMKPNPNWGTWDYFQDSYEKHCGECKLYCNNNFHHVKTISNLKDSNQPVRLWLHTHTLCIIHTDWLYSKVTRDVGGRGCCWFRRRMDWESIPKIHCNLELERY